MSGNLDQVKKGFQFLINNRGKEIRFSDLAAFTGWKPSTVRTYYGKKWKGQVLAQVSRGIYRVTMPESMTWEGFESLHTQVDAQVG